MRTHLAVGCWFFGWLVASTGCGSDAGPTPDVDAGAGAFDAAAGSDASMEQTDGALPVDADVVDDASSAPLDAGAEAGPAADAGSPADAATDGGLPPSMPCTATGSCDPFDPTSCPGQVCRPGTLGIACYDVAASPGAEGAPCAAPDQCMPGTLCLSFGGAGFTCQRMCARGSVGDCGAARACTGTVGDACVQVCRPLPARCDVYAQDCAAATDGCTLVTHPETGEAYTGCRPAGTRALGETCGGADGTCTRGALCIRSAGVASCRQACDATAAAPGCPMGEACTGVARTWSVGYCVPM